MIAEEFAEALFYMGAPDVAGVRLIAEQAKVKHSIFYEVLKNA
jgi:hypothetical protein